MIVMEIERPLQKKADGRKQRGAGEVEPWRPVRAGRPPATCLRQADPAAALRLRCPTLQHARQVSFTHLLRVRACGVDARCAEGL